MRESTLALDGKKCLIMRQADNEHPLVKGVKQLGGTPLQVPLIAFKKKRLSEREIEAVKKIHTYDWCVFTSQNGVHFFMETLSEMELTFPKEKKVAAVGSKTEKVLNSLDITVDYVPEKFTGDHLAAAMRERVSPGERILVVKGNLARDVVGQVLKEIGCIVEDVVIYETVFPEESKVRLVHVMEREHPEVLIFTSPSTVDNFVHIAGDRLPEFIDGKVIVSIGPVTNKALKKYEMPIHVSPEIYTIDEMLKQLALYYRGAI